MSTIKGCPPPSPHSAHRGLTGRTLAKGPQQECSAKPSTAEDLLKTRGIFALNNIAPL
jgi:hypothetical protein